MGHWSWKLARALHLWLNTKAKCLWSPGTKRFLASTTLNESKNVLKAFKCQAAHPFLWNPRFPCLGCPTLRSQTAPVLGHSPCEGATCWQRQSTTTRRAGIHKSNENMLHWTQVPESGSHARDTRPCKLDYQSEEPPTVRPPRSSTPASASLKCNLPPFTLVSRALQWRSFPLCSTDLHGGPRLHSRLATTWIGKYMNSDMHASRLWHDPHLLENITIWPH